MVAQIGNYDLADVFQGLNFLPIFIHMFSEEVNSMQWPLPTCESNGNFEVPHTGICLSFLDDFWCELEPILLDLVAQD